MNCCDWECTQGRNCPVRKANAELQKSAKLIRRVRAGQEPPPDVANPIVEPEYLPEVGDLFYLFGITMAWVILVSFVAGIFWGLL